jgi:competence protein ComEC
MSRRNFLIFFVCISMLLSLRLYTHHQSQIAYKNGEQIHFTATLSAEPTYEGARQQLRVTPPKRERLFLTLPYQPQYHFGDRLTISGTVAERVYGDRRIYILNKPKVSRSTQKHGFYQYITSIRSHIMRLYSQTLSVSGASLMSGIVLGSDDELPKSFKNNLQVTGLLHVVAASGMNVTLVAGVLIIIASALFRRQVALVVAIGGIWFYALLAGLQPSIVRAALMATITITAAIIGRQSLALWGLGLTAYIMLLTQPGLMSDIGFQLSVLATIGIILFGQYMTVTQQKDSGKETILLLDDLKTTFAAQVMTVPLMLYYFHEYGLVSLLVNGLVLWTVPLLMMVGGIAGLLSFVLEPVASIILYLAVPLLLYFEWVVAMCSSLGMVVRVPAFPIPVLLGVYCIILSIILFSRSSIKSRS